MATMLKVNEVKPLEKMNKHEKEKFFPLDLAERMIRVEQNISNSFHCPVEMEQTEYFKSMMPEQQQELKKFIENRKKKMAISFLWLLFPLILLSLLNLNFTGNAIKESMGATASNGLEVGIFIAFGVVLIIIALAFIYQNISERRLNKHINLIKPVLYRSFVDKKTKQDD